MLTCDSEILKRCAGRSIFADGRPAWDIEGNCFRFRRPHADAPVQSGEKCVPEWELGTPKVGRSSALLRPVDVWEFTPSAGYTSCNVVAYLIWATSCEDNIGSGLGNLQPGERYI